MQPFARREVPALVQEESNDVEDELQDQSINLLQSLSGIEVALSIRTRGSCIKRMTKIKVIKYTNNNKKNDGDNRQQQRYEEDEVNTEKNTSERFFFFILFFFE